MKIINLIFPIRFAEQSITNKNPTTHSRSNAWSATNTVEMSAFLGLWLMMGLIKKPSIESYWNTADGLFSSPGFGQTMSRNRFQLILQYLHCNNNQHARPIGSEDYDPAYKIRPILDILNKSFKESYNLGT